MESTTVAHPGDVTVETRSHEGLTAVEARRNRMGVSFISTEDGHDHETVYAHGIVSMRMEASTRGTIRISAVRANGEAVYITLFSAGGGDLPITLS